MIPANNKHGNQFVTSIKNATLKPPDLTCLTTEQRNTSAGIARDDINKYQVCYWVSSFTHRNESFYENLWHQLALHNWERLTVNITLMTITRMSEKNFRFDRCLDLTPQCCHLGSSFQETFIGNPCHYGVWVLSKIYINSYMTDVTKIELFFFWLKKLHDFEGILLFLSSKTLFVLDDANSLRHNLRVALPAIGAVFINHALSSAHTSVIFSEFL